MQHYTSLELTTVNASTVFQAVKETFEKDEIPLKNIISSLSDSAAYMRGKVSGFETRLRNEVLSLLDIDGDLCHHVHNAVKKCCENFDKHIEKLADDLYNDFHYSPDLQEHLSNICSSLHVACKIPTERVAHRWLSAYDVTSRNVEMLDALTIFYFAWVGTENRKLHERTVNDIIIGAKASKKHIYDDVLVKLKQKQLTQMGL